MIPGTLLLQDRNHIDGMLYGCKNVSLVPSEVTVLTYFFCRFRRYVS
jgi:hypothetical protein